MLDVNIFFPPGSRAPHTLEGHGFFLYGGRRCGKTSLVFQASVNCVLSGGRVVVLCHEAVLAAKLPKPFTRLTAVPEEALQRIEFIYVDSWTTVTRELMALSQLQEAPSLIIVDDDGFSEDVVKRDRTPGPKAVAQGLSFMDNYWDWMHRNGRDFTYVVVTNRLADSAGRLGLPYTAFPLVHLYVSSTGLVEVTPTAADRSPIEVVSLRWADGLELAEGSP